MPTPLLSTKLIVPPLRQSLVPRQHLIDKLNAGLQAEGELFHRSLTLVSAPAGYGKTTLISSWLHQLDKPAAWLSLDVGDNDVNRFVFYVVAALQEVHNELGATVVSLLQTSQPPVPQTLFTLLINDITTWQKKVVLVLDDYHVIQDLAIHEAVEFLLNNQPPRLHLVIISREDPALHLHRLRSSGRMNGLYAHDLRFASDEAERFLNETMGLSLTPDEVATLERRTEGWVAGLQLAALSMKDLPDPRGFVTTFAGDDRYISDYLIGEVIERQPEQVQEFLMKTAILDRFCVPLCEAIFRTGDQDLGIGDQGQMGSSQAIIERLDLSNLFIVSLDNKREWYRYHHLFANFLRLRVRALPEEQVSELHRRASEWFENNGHPAKAVEHALAARDYERAAQLIEQNAMETLWGHTQWTTLLDWIESLPLELVRSRLQLSLQYAWALFTTGRWEEVESFLHGVEMTIGEGKETTEAVWMLGEVTTIRALVAYEEGNMKRCGDLSHKALKLLPDDNVTIRSVAILAKGMAHLWGGDVQTTRQIFQEASDMAQTADNMTVALIAIGYRMQLEIREGQLQKAAELYQQARHLGSLKGNILLGPVGFACIQMGEVLREWNQLEQAKETLLEGLKLCQQQSGMREYILEGQINLARTMLASSDKQHAAETIQQVEALIAELLGRGDNVLPIISMALAYRLRFWLAQGNLDIAAGWLASNGISVDADISSVNEEFFILLIRVLIHQDRLDDAEKLLQRLLEAVRKTRLTVESWVLQALLFQEQGDRGQAVTALTQALRLAEPEGYLRLFVDQNKSIIPLLDQVAGRSAAPANLKSILAVLAEQSHFEERAVAIAQSPESTTLVEPLKDQEIRILGLMAAGLSNREIADELFLSVNTVKVYASRIYNKLGVHRRAEAIFRARELGFI